MIRYTFESTLNGWLCRRQNEDGSMYTIVGKASETEEQISFAEFLKDVTHELGFYGSRYDKYRVHVSLLPGDKFSGDLDEKYRNDLENLRDEINYILEGDNGTLEAS